MKNQRKFKGALCESLAIFYLMICGYTPLKRNMRTAIGEIDILAKKGSLLCLVEVKFRKTEQAAHMALRPDQVDRLQKQMDGLVQRYKCSEYRCDAALFYAKFPFFSYIKHAF